MQQAGTHASGATFTTMSHDDLDPPGCSKHKENLGKFIETVGGVSCPWGQDAVARG